MIIVVLFADELRGSTFQQPYKRNSTLHYITLHYSLSLGCCYLNVLFTSYIFSFHRDSLCTL